MLVIVVKFHHLFLAVASTLAWVFGTLIVLQVVEAEGRPRYLSPRIMYCLPRFATQEGFSSPTFWSFVFHIPPEIGAYQVVARIHIEFLEEEIDRPIRTLNMQNAQHRAGAPFILGHG